MENLTEEKSINYPIRINKYLALKNICSRREADDLIKEGRVKINGLNAKLGNMVKEGDKVAVNNNKKYFYYVLNKPKGIVTHSPQKEERDIFDVVKFPNKVAPLGRLDKDSSGLIFLTNDGRITDKLLNPIHKHEKEYKVRVNKTIANNFIEKMSRGVVLDDGYKTKECLVKKEGSTVFLITLVEGKKRQIRRMCEILGYKVIELKRIRIMNIRLDNLKSGEFRPVGKNELKEFKNSLGL